MVIPGSEWQILQMAWISKFLGLLGLMKSTPIVALHSDRSSGDPVKRAKSCDGHQSSMESL